MRGRVGRGRIGAAVGGAALVVNAMDHRRGRMALIVDERDLELPDARRSGEAAVADGYPNALLALAVRASRKADGLRELDYDDIEAEVHGGEVFLRGHVGSVMHKRDAEQRAGAVRGAGGVHSDLVADSDLVIAVAQALAANQITRAFNLHVGASEGWVQLGGEVPDAQVRTAAETIAAGVPDVRGVLGLPHLSGEHTDGHRRTLQPRAGASVYADDGEIGKVTAVMINPRNRLVSHIVVDAHLDLGRREVRGQFVIPVEAIRMNSVGGTMLLDSIRMPSRILLRVRSESCGGDLKVR